VRGEAFPKDTENLLMIINRDKRNSSDVRQFKSDTGVQRLGYVA
jgi:hypothetical protein